MIMIIVDNPVEIILSALIYDNYNIKTLFCEEEQLVYNQSTLSPTTYNDIKHKIILRICD